MLESLSLLMAYITTSINHFKQMPLFRNFSMKHTMRTISATISSIFFRLLFSTGSNIKLRNILCIQNYSRSLNFRETLSLRIL